MKAFDSERTQTKGGLKYASERDLLKKAVRKGTKRGMMVLRKENPRAELRANYAFSLNEEMEVREAREGDTPLGTITRYSPSGFTKVIVYFKDMT